MLQVLARDIEQLTDPSDPCLLLGKDTWRRRLIFGKLYCLVYLGHFSFRVRVLWLAVHVVLSHRANWCSRYLQSDQAGSIYLPLPVSRRETGQILVARYTDNVFEQRGSKRAAPY
jgi:hypothetical protein